MEMATLLCHYIARSLFGGGDLAKIEDILRFQLFCFAKKDDFMRIAPYM